MRRYGALLVAIGLVGLLVGGCSSLFNLDGSLFPDPNLEQAVREAISKPEGELLPSDLIGLEDLRAKGQGIVDLEGIQYCSDLTYLDLDDNQIVDISPLSGLTNLMWLSLRENKVVDISPLSGLINLTIFDLTSNEIVDISPLSGLTNLTWFSLWENKVVDISPLSEFTNLTVLYLGVNEVVNISALSGLTNLTGLYLEANEIVDIWPLVLNGGLGMGDVIVMRFNNLDTSPGSLDMRHINYLIDRGVRVYY